jgi:hypothetical protein
MSLTCVFLGCLCSFVTQDSDSDSDADSDEKSGDNDDDDADEWASDSESDDESDEEAEGAYAQLTGRARWLEKKNTCWPTKKVVKDKDERAKSSCQKAERAAEAAAQAAESSMASKSVLPVESLTPSMINKRSSGVGRLARTLAGLICDKFLGNCKHWPNCHMNLAHVWKSPL